MKTLSIRTRLLLASVVLVMLGLVIADAATYGFLRSSLFTRIDAQLVGARLSAARALVTDGSGSDFGPGGRRDELPSVAYAELLDSSGNVLASHSFGFQTITALPPLPPKLPGMNGARGTVAYFNTRSGIGSARYRVLASSLTGGGTLVVAAPLSDADATLRRLLLVEGIVTFTVLLGVAALALWAIGVGLRPLEEMESAASDIAGGNLSRRVEPADARTEVGRLGLALNAMLEKIEAAFAERRAAETKLRLFIGDASHELRTPLTSIRGYAELFRRGAGERPEDLAMSMRRIEEEAARMGVLVDELLLLARLDQGRPLERAPVDVARIASDAVADARAIDPARPIDVAGDSPMTIEGDEIRLRQVVANLLSNALAHTPAGTPVHVRTSRNETHVRIEVADEGPGMSEEDRARIFDRFFRVDPSRARESGGSGLGLSIVNAIVHAHGGTVRAESAPGEGARFLVVLPVAAPGAPSSEENAARGSAA